MIGKTLGHYKIIEQLGKGGMGEVYQATDTKLGRDVAIKVLPVEFAKDTDRVARFQREAKLLASLNHPNIAAIYGLEESDGTNFLVMELVEGQTLDARIKSGAIPVEDALKLALQIAEALEAAHEKGVIHRDLKPANIKVTPDSKVKVLDFGLAKAYAGEQADLNLSNSPTLSQAATMQGVILGTAAYMSPEQARGKSVDKRTDIWAFGCVLYEMLTGKAAFQGEDVTEILASVVKLHPNLDLLPTNIHSRLRTVLERCFEKDLIERFRDIGDVRYEVEQVLTDPEGVFIKPVIMVARSARLRTIMLYSVIAILCLIIVGVVAWTLKSSEPRKVVRFYHELEEGQQFGNLEERGIAVSPDGAQLVYQTTSGLYKRSINELSASPISGTEELPRKPFFSWDSKKVGYVSEDGSLKTIPINGGTATVLGRIFSSGFLHWDAEDRIVFTDRQNIKQIPLIGGNPEILVEVPGSNNLAPQILPGGKTVMFTSGPRPHKIMLVSIESREITELIAHGDSAQYLPSGYIVYAVEGSNSLYAVPFDLKKLKVTGDAVPVIPGVLRSGGAPQFSVSDSGVLAYIQGPSSITTGTAFHPAWVDRGGKVKQIQVPFNQYLSPRISPDGMKIAWQAVTEGNTDIHVWDIERGTNTRITYNEAMDMVPIWTIDGKRIIFASSREEYLRIYSKAADGTEKEAQLLFDGSELSLPALFPSTLSPDGNTLVLMTGSGDIGSISMDGNPEWKPLLEGEYEERHPRISPDGKWIVYESDETGQFEIYIRPFPDVNSDKRTVSTRGGIQPLWSGDSRHIFYISGNEVVMVALLETEPELKLGKPEVFFPIENLSLANDYLSIWDIHPEELRFLVIEPPNEGDESASEIPHKIVVVLNWFEELKKLVPVD